MINFRINQSQTAKLIISNVTDKKSKWIKENQRHYYQNLGHALKINIALEMHLFSIELSHLAF